MEFDDEILETAVKRKRVLAALAEGPHHRRELQNRLDCSKATCHRIIRSLDEKGLLRRTDDGYELSEVGRIVGDRVRQFEETVRTARELAPLVEGIARSDLDFDVELFTDANVERARQNDPYPPVERFIELFRDSDTLRNVGPTPIPPTMVDEVFDVLFSEGKRIDIIKPRSIVSKYVSEYDHRGRKAAQRDQLGCRVYEDLPFGMSLFDDHLGLRGYDPETGTPIVSADTADPEAVAWGEDVFQYYREQSAPLSQFEEFPEWAREELTLEI